MVSPVVLVNVSNQLMHIPVTVDQTVKTVTLINSGAGGMFINETFAWNHNLLLTRLINPILVYNVDGTWSKQGEITQYTWKELSITEVTHRAWLLVTSLGKESIILGLPWLRCMNAQIDWKSRKIEFKGTLPTMPLIQKRPKTTVEDV